MPFDYIPPLLRKEKTKIVLLVMDGLGGLPVEPGGPTELEAAVTPNMDRLAAEGTLGQTIPIRPGITPGSGPAHLALFGYDPIIHEIGRGTLEAVGVGMEVRKGDVAARGNFCTLDPAGNISDRRAGRIPTPEALPVVEKLKKVEIPGVSTEVRHVKEYRFAVVMRGEGLDPEIKDTDPQVTGLPPLPAKASSESAERTAALFNQWIVKARQLIADEPKANGITLRGFATHPGLISFEEAYGLRAACVAVYPMYRGVSQLVGMDVIQFPGEDPEDEFTALGKVWGDYDLSLIHI
jgi:2,3-bisphosphoglycerate-independent phosphoglycerate mutase